MKGVPVEERALIEPWRRQERSLSSTVGIRLPGIPRADPGVQFSRTGFLGRTRFRVARLQPQANTRRLLTSVIRGLTMGTSSKTRLNRSQV